MGCISNWTRNCCRGEWFATLYRCISCHLTSSFCCSVDDVSDNSTFSMVCRFCAMSCVSFVYASRSDNSTFSTVCHFCAMSCVSFVYTSRSDNSTFGTVCRFCPMSCVSFVYTSRSDNSTFSVVCHFCPMSCVSFVYTSRSDNSTLSVVCRFCPMSYLSCAQKKPLNIYSLCRRVKLWISATLLTGHRAELHVTGGKRAYKSFPTLNASLR